MIVKTCKVKSTGPSGKKYLKILSSLVVASVVQISMVHAEDQSSGNDKLSQDRTVVNESCKTEATTAGCGDQVVGKGLLRCIRKYKKEHKKEFQISDNCKSAMKQLKEDREEHKGKKHEEKK